MDLLSMISFISFLITFSLGIKIYFNAERDIMFK